MTEPNKFRPALIGGLLVGIAALIPYIAWGGFLWAVIGGIVASKMLITQSPSALTLGRGAKLGLVAGLIGGGIYLVINTPLMATPIIEMLKASTQNTPESVVALEKLSQSPMSKYVLSFIISLIIAILLLGFTVLGGVLGIAFFEKRKPEAMESNNGSAPASEKQQQ